jgi:hypothetical protein
MKGVIHMDLQLETVRTRGRAPAAISASLVREIEAPDLDLLALEKGSKAPALKRLSDRHHALARAISSGMPMGEAALICGYDISRVSILKDDPSFQELLEFYREEKDRAFRSVNDKLAGMASDALDELQTRIEDEPDKFTIPQLLAVITTAADRSGNGPQSSTTNLNLNVGLADRLEEARKRVKERRLRIAEEQSQT